MSLDDFFDRIERLEGRHLITMPCSFVKTARIMTLYLPISFKSVVEKYFPSYLITEVGNEIRVKKENKRGR